LLVDDKETSKRELATAVRLLPNDGPLAMAAAMTHGQLGSEEEALANYKRAADLAPREPKIFYNWGTLLNALGRPAEARAALDQALVLAPASVYFRLYRASAELGWSGDIARAKAILAALPAGQDPDGRVTSAFCTFALTERNFPEAMRLLQEYPSETLPAVGGSFGGFGPPEPKALSEGIVHFFAGDRDRANACFEQVRERIEAAVRAKPTAPEQHYHLASLYSLMGWREAAIAEAARVGELEEAAGLSPRRRNTLGLAQVYALIGEADLAWQKIEQVLAVPSTYTLHNFRLDPVWDPIRKDPRFQKLLETGKL
jgi:hypothetical protein